MTANVKRAQRALEEQGYVVMAFMPGPKPAPKVGEVIPGPLSGVPGPFVVVGEATRAEMIRQVKRYGSDYHMQMLAIGWFNRAVGFYRLVAE